MEAWHDIDVLDSDEEVDNVELESHSEELDSKEAEWKEAETDVEDKEDETEAEPEDDEPSLVDGIDIDKDCVDGLVDGDQEEE